MERVRLRAGIAAVTFVLVGAGVFGVGDEVAPAKATAKPASNSVAKYIKRRSKIQPQRILTQIAYEADPTAKLLKLVRPIRARVASDVIGYRTPPCYRKGSGRFSFFQRNSAGTGYDPCGSFAMETDILRGSRPNEYRPLLKRLGSRVLKSIGIKARQQARSVAGNRKKLTARYKCPEELKPSGVIAGNIERVVLRKARKGSRATIKRCS